MQTDLAPAGRLVGRRAIVTGAARGIGAAIAAAMRAEGAAVAVLDISTDVKRVADELDGIAIAVDLADVAATAAAMTAAIDGLGGVDVLVNNAANDDRHSIEDVTPAYWDERMATNLRHIFFAAQAVIPSMRAAGGGSIINLGSISWHLGLPDLVVYQTAKAAIEGMTRSLARDLGRDGIRVNTIIPGNVQTPRQERWYTPEGEAEIVADQCLNGRIQPADIAAMALFLASDDARMCTGHDYWVDAGWR